MTEKEADLVLTKKAKATVTAAVIGLLGLSGTASYVGSGGLGPRVSELEKEEAAHAAQLAAIPSPAKIQAELAALQALATGSAAELVELRKQVELKTAANAAKASTNERELERTQESLRNAQGKLDDVNEWIKNQDRRIVDFYEGTDSPFAAVRKDLAMLKSAEKTRRHLVEDVAELKAQVELLLRQSTVKRPR